MTNFYRLQKPFDDEEYYVYGQPMWRAQFGLAEWSDHMLVESIRCCRDPGHQRAGERIGDLSVVLPMPKVCDFVWTWFSDCLMTDRVLASFQEQGFTGFEPRPVTIEKVKRVPKGVVYTPPALWELRVTGTGGYADPSSGIRVIGTCDACGLVERSTFRNGLRVNSANWDGSDFCTVIEYPRYFLVTERVKNFIVAQKLINCALVPTEELVAID